MALEYGASEGTLERRESHDTAAIVFENELHTPGALDSDGLHSGAASSKAAGALMGSAAARGMGLTFGRESATQV